MPDIHNTEGGQPPDVVSDDSAAREMIPKKKEQGHFGFKPKLYPLQWANLSDPGKITKSQEYILTVFRTIDEAWAGPSRRTI